MKILQSKLVTISIFLFTALFTAQASLADVVLVANPGAPDKSLTAQQASDIFLGKQKNFPSGGSVVPIDQEKGEAPRDEFYSKVVKKDASQLNAYWSRLVFTGKGQPPKAVLDDDEVIELVSSNPNIIGYIDAGSVTDAVIVILKP